MPLPPPLLLVTSALPQIPKSDLIQECRRLLSEDGDWLFLMSSNTSTFRAFQLNNHGASVSQTKSIVEETLSSVCPSIAFKVLEPTLGFIQRSNQTIPISAKTTIVRYKATPGDRGKVIYSCRELFRFAEEEEMDVYSLAIMNDVGLDDEFVILERYESAEAEQRHLESERVVQCLGEVKGMILEHESVGYEILDV